MADEVQRFRQVAERYCALIDSLDELSRYELLSELNRVLPDLYTAAVSLPERFQDGPDPPDGISHDQWWDLVKRLQHTLGDADHYRSVFDPWAPEEEAIDRTLSDDVADIYQELKSVLADETVNAWDWRFAFVSHWGAHAAQALLATHWLFSTGGGAPS